MATNTQAVESPNEEGAPPNPHHVPPFLESGLVLEVDKHLWDPTDETVAGDEQTGDSTIFTKAAKLLKVLFYLATFCVVIGCGVLSKGTLLLMTSAIRKNRTFPVCHEAAGLERDLKYVLQLSEEERRSWIWCMLFILFIPEFLTFLRCSRLCIFKMYNKPKISSFLMVMLAETLHAGGLVLLTFVVLPELHVLNALSVTNAVCVVPSLIHVISSWSSLQGTQSVMKNVLNLSAFMCQTSIFVWAAVHSISAEIWAAVSVLLVSFAWWENFVNQTPKCISKTKDDIERSRNFIYIFISLWKILLIFGLSIVCLFANGEDVKSFITKMPDSFEIHDLSAHLPEINLFNISDMLKQREQIPVPSLKSKVFLPGVIAGIHAAASYLCYVCGKFVCKICIQPFSYALPICLTIPLTITLLNTACENKLLSSCALPNTPPYIFWNCHSDQPTDFFEEEASYFWVFWLLSQVWITIHVWHPQCKRMASTNKLFVNPMYCSILIDQSMALNRRRNEKGDGKRDRRVNNSISEADDTSRIFACATMWHETPDEMEQLLKSIMRMDVHQCSQKTMKYGLEIRNPDYYEMEAHIFFDDAFVVSDEDDEKMTINCFVKDFIDAVNTAAGKVYTKCAKPEPPIKIPTPYGGRLMWFLPGANALVVHLKNKELIRHKKRWSQVMYMYYLLEYRLRSRLYGIADLQKLLQNTFILALDGDIDFKPNAVQLLVDLMNRNKGLGAACGRIHPVGTGMMVYYQKFEYAIGHWLQKATEHMIGCVLCSPGCFSLFRAEALVKKNTIRTYATKSREAIEYVQFDQGEDRWLCTLLLQRGYRVEYSAASDAYTHCPETFAEFYTQRRRWAPSTMANIMDLLINYKTTVERNDNISRPYVAYQGLLMVGTILGPGTIFLMLVGAMVSAFKISNWQSFIANIVPIVFFILICFHAKNDTQIFVAQTFSALYALLMMAVLVGMSLQLVLDGITSPTAIFIIAMTASFIIAALAHPQEFWCVAHGLIYFLSVPSMYLLLALYSFINLHVVSWGTREVQTKKTKKQLEQERLHAQKTVMPQSKSGMFDWLGDKYFQLGPEANGEEGGISFGVGNLFRCMCCTYPKPDTSSIQMLQIEAHLKEINRDIHGIQRQLDSSVNQMPGFRRKSCVRTCQRDSNLDTLAEDDIIDHEVYEEDESDKVEEHTYNQPDNYEYWLSDVALKDCDVLRLTDGEKIFWTELIDTYLHPLADDPDEKAKISRQLLELRNKVVFGILMLNSLFILVVFLLQMQKDTLHIEWPLNGKANITYIASRTEILIEFEYLQLEPINLVLVFFFTLILVIQFIAMLFHRLETLAHILSSTSLFEVKSKETQTINLSQLTKELLQEQGLKDDDAEFSLPADNGVREETHFLGISNGFIANTETETTSLACDRPRGRPKFRSLSIALEQDLQKILRKDREFALKVRRQSRNPDAFDALMRRSSLYSSTRTSSMTGTYRNGQLDGVLGHASPTPSARSCLYYNPSFKDSLETQSVNDIQMRTLNSPPASNAVDALFLQRFQPAIKSRRNGSDQQETQQ